MKKIGLLSILTFLAVSAGAFELYDLADEIDPFVGVIGEGACMPGPCLPFASIYPSPDTLNADNGGYSYTEDIVGFAQLHTQGTGGTASYGNILVSPQIGLQTEESLHSSAKSNESAEAYRYQVNLTDYNIFCELAPTKHCAIYSFEFPAAGNAHITIDAARKINGGLGLDNGSVIIDTANNKITGGGEYKNNWPATSEKTQIYFCAKFDKAATDHGCWTGTTVSSGATTQSATDAKLGAYFKYTTTANEVSRGSRPIVSTRGRLIHRIYPTR
jgi:putative alpha-1,2-mannosidase